ncbi:MAG: hypothetical protein QOF05_1488 [Sphingomonadales bacterium]|jgi:hypothetical protein|nr:hypothetical protein [Sphingomonadales bacterium]
MTRTTLLITLAAAAALAGCNSKGNTITGDSPGDNIAANAAVALPPSITSSKSYRCKDNHVVYIDWMSDGTARVKKTREELGGTPVTPGTDLKGDPTVKTITYSGQSCNS